MSKKVNVTLFVVVLSAALGTSAVPARAELYGFTPITSNTDGSVAQQLGLEVTSGVSGVLFTFLNNLAPGPVVGTPLSSCIAQVYFDDRAGVLSGLNLISNGPGVVSFLSGATPGDLPGGTNLTPAFSTGFSAGAVSPAPTNGVNPGEGLTLGFGTGASLADVLTVLNKGLGDPTDPTGTLRVGIHVTQLPLATGGTTSDSFVLEAPRVPVPATFVLAMLGLTVAGVKLRRFA